MGQIDFLRFYQHALLTNPSTDRNSPLLPRGGIPCSLETVILSLVLSPWSIGSVLAGLVDVGARDKSCYSSHIDIPA